MKNKLKYFFLTLAISVIFYNGCVEKFELPTLSGDLGNIAGDTAVSYTHLFLMKRTNLKPVLIFNFKKCRLLIFLNPGLVNLD